MFSGRVLESFLCDVETMDPLVTGALLGMLVAVGLATTALPAGAACRIPPTEAMRVE